MNDKKIPLCECGCGKQVNKITNRYLVGHSGGGFWQNKYNKDSDEYKQIVKKIKKSTSESMVGIKKTKKHCNNIAAGRKNWIKNNRNYFNEITIKMKQTKNIQSEKGTLSEKHYVNNKKKNEINDIYKRIVKKANNTKNNKKELGIYPDIWNKGKNKFNDSRVAKYSRENHYLWNPNKINEYDDMFYNPNYRKYLLERQNKICILCDTDKYTLCLHHIDKNKKNSKEDNLVYACRKCHLIIHKTYDVMTKHIKEKMNGIFR